MRTMIVKTPRTVPNGMSRHSTPAMTRQNRYFALAVVAAPVTAWPRTVRSGDEIWPEAE